MVLHVNDEPPIGTSQRNSHLRLRTGVNNALRDCAYSKALNIHVEKTLHFIFFSYPILFHRTVKSIHVSSYSEYPDCIISIINSLGESM